MGTTVLYIMLFLAFTVFIGFIVYAVISGRKQKSNVIQLADIPAIKDENLQVKVTKEGNGVNILIYSSYEDRPSDAELFPDIVDDVAPPVGALDRAFWEKVANIANITDPAEREEIATRLASHGFIEQENISSWSMPSPEEDGEDTGDVEPENEEAYRAILDEIEFEQPEKEYEFEI